MKKISNIQGLVINCTGLFANLAISNIVLSLVYYLRAGFNLTAGQIGMMSQVMTLFYIAGCLLIAPVSQRLKPRHSVSLAFFIMAATQMVLVRATSLQVVFAALAVWGLSTALLWPALEAWMSRGKSAEQLGRAASSYNFNWSFGVALSSLIAGFLLEINYDYPFYFGVGLLTVLGASIAVIGWAVPSIRAQVSERDKVAGEHKSDHSTPLRFACWIGNMTGYLILFSFQTAFPLYGADVLGITESVTGTLLLVRGLATCFTFIFLARGTWWHFNKKVVFLNQATMLVEALLLCFCRSVLSFGVVCVFFGISFAFGYSLAMFHSVAGCVNETKRMTVHELFISAGVMSGSVSGGFLYQYFGFSKVFLYYAIALSAVISVEFLLYRHHRALALSAGR